MTVFASVIDRLRQGPRAAAFMPMARIVEEAKAEATTLTLRHDVPQGPDVPTDLKDEKGRFFGQGYRIAGRMLTDDLLRGSPTPTAPVVLALLPVLTQLAVVLNNVLGGFGTLLGISFLATALWALNEAVQRRWVLIAAAMGVGIPLVLGQGLLQGFIPAAAGFGAARLLMPVGIAILVVTGLVWFFAHDRRAAARFLSWSLGLAVAFMLVLALLPRALHPVFWLGVGALPALIYTRQQTKGRALRLAYQGQVATMESTGKLKGAHIDSRRQQVENAMADASTFVQLGVAKGVFTALHDGYAPDAGLPFGLTHNDLAQHLVCMGGTGTGKTSRVIRPVLRSVIASRDASPIGLVVLDGKSALAAELRGVPGYTFIEPTSGITLGLIEGLRPQAVIETLRDTRVGSRPDDTGGGESGSYFTDAAEVLLTHAAIILEALVLASKAGEKEGRERDWHWTIYDLNRVMTLVSQAGDGYADSEFARMVGTPGGLIHDFGESEHVRTGLFVAAVEYVRDAWTVLDLKLRGSIFSTATKWYEPLLFDELVLPWVKAETGFDVTQVLQGAWLGMCMPTEKYGKRGRIVQAMVKRRIFNRIYERAELSDWTSERGATPVLFVVDEAQDVITREDATFSAKCRSLGGRLCYASQHFESFQAAFDKNESLTKKFLDDFGSTVVFAASFQTYRWLSEDKLGQIEAFVSTSHGGGIDFRFTAELALSSPLLDPNHPMRREMKALVRQGAGAVDESLMRRGRGEIRSAQEAELFDRPESIGEATLAGLSIQPVMSGAWKTRALLEPQEWATYTKQPGVAIAQVQRGGVPRRDVIQCAFVPPLNALKKA